MSPILYSSEKLPLYFIAREVSLPGCSQAYETVPGYHKDDLIFILSFKHEQWGYSNILALPFLSILQQTLGTGRSLKLLICFCLLLHWANR